jgi:hypothetical protein
MAYTLRAVVARCGAFADPPAWIADSAVIALPQGLCMVPLTEAVRYAFGPAERPWLYETHSIFTHLPQALAPHLRELSRVAAVAYVEAEYHGGDGEQRSIVWQDGAPLGEPEESSGAINDALRRLGVEQAEGADRFDTLGLGRHRSVDDWLQSIRPPAQPAIPASAPAPESTAARPPWWRLWR